ncbi:unnamed protein product [Notodromas monacha]|uniref:Mitochondrial ribosomal protein S17 n=1 Tax=Notodromas monacha TaxID=399045 RepID=A0A7R9BEG6_9CRUS|nr:unnamed protein product [Notodromas monacha]CAG0913282.1 unnamed protein product [Notodromas monacha]
MPRQRLAKLAGLMIPYKHGMHRPSKMLAGTVHPSNVPDTVKVVVTRQIFHESMKLSLLSLFNCNFLSHFDYQFYPEKEAIYVKDPAKACNIGDIVLVKKLPEQANERVSHVVQEVLFACGDVTDPVTGEKVSGSQYRFMLDLEDKMVREALKSDTSARECFIREKAPKRGSTELDKSYEDVYIRYDARIEDDHAVDAQYHKL